MSDILPNGSLVRAKYALDYGEGTIVSCETYDEDGGVYEVDFGHTIASFDENNFDVIRRYRPPLHPLPLERPRRKLTINA
jgi:hypothetical protein